MAMKTFAGMTFGDLSLSMSSRKRAKLEKPSRFGLHFNFFDGVWNAVYKYGFDRDDQEAAVPFLGVIDEKNGYFSILDD